jgi:hypothetical protein
MQEKVWKLRSKSAASGNRLGEKTFTTEAGFIAGLHDAWRIFASDISATLPDGSELEETALQQRFAGR